MRPLAEKDTTTRSTLSSETDTVKDAWYSDRTGDLSEYFYALLRHVGQEHDRIVEGLRQQAHVVGSSNPPTQYQNTYTYSLGTRMDSDRSPDSVALTRSSPLKERVDAFLTTDDPPKPKISRASVSPKPLHVKSMLDYLGWDDSVIGLTDTADWVPSSARLARLTTHAGFDIVCALVTCANLVRVGSLIDLKAQGHKVHKIETFFISLLFSLFFLTELVMRIFSYGAKHFFLRSRNRLWNAFDTIVLLLDIPEMIVCVLENGGRSAGIPLFRVLRLFRAARAVRLVRLARQVTQIRLMVKILMVSMGTFFWSVVLFGISTYIFSTCIMFTLISPRSDESREIDSNAENILATRFSTTWQTMLTLFFAVSGGLDWHEVGEALFQVGLGSGLVIVTYVFFVHFAVLNTISGIFLESAIENVRNDREEITRLEIHAERAMLKTLKSVFNKADADESETLSFKEFCAMLKSEKTLALLRRVGLEVHEAQGLFHLVDIAGTGEVTLDDFLVACVRLKGSGKQVDLVSLMFETKKLAFELQPLIEYAKARQGIGEPRRILNSLPHQVHCKTKESKYFEESRYLEPVAESDPDCLEAGYPSQPMSGGRGLNHESL